MWLMWHQAHKGVKMALMVFSWYFGTLKAVNIHWFAILARHRTYDSSSYAPIFSPLLSTSDADWESIPWSHHLKHPSFSIFCDSGAVIDWFSVGTLYAFPYSESHLLGLSVERLLMFPCLWWIRLWKHSSTPWNYALKCLILAANTSLSWDGG